MYSISGAAKGYFPSNAELSSLQMPESLSSSTLEIAGELR
jgi:hypothetical protein